MTNREFSKDKEFIECCERANVKPTARQASKFRNQQGLAYKIGKKENENRQQEFEK